MDAAREQGERLAAAMPAVIEQARWDAKLRSARALAAAAGMTHTYLNARLAGDIVFTVRDLGSLGVALGVDPAELLRRAAEIAALEDEHEEIAAHDSEGTIEEEQEAPEFP
ncbi:hypothetical protein F9L07_28355 [Pimelobacter simplex]|uniref:HTH cro/C1-type domain-containing protein n=1 Tax=Nocardioides simplex TaxID=2045 RepID=A0A7J5DQV2_NOCSI|nr:hypothetical protein [Pimelobacter simplex]KAB2806947.1 hypothetical protein F9L07_28355 [Pimelobacter simplex]